jgi:hypothetical protein
VNDPDGARQYSFAVLSDLESYGWPVRDVCADCRYWRSSINPNPPATSICSSVAARNHPPANLLANAPPRTVV